MLEWQGSSCAGSFEILSLRRNNVLLGVAQFCLESLLHGGGDIMDSGMPSIHAGFLEN